MQLEKFSVSFYPTGAPKEFKSIVTIMEKERKILTEPILVNHPFTYKGISLYQSSYGVAGVEKAILAVKDRQSGEESPSRPRWATGERSRGAPALSSWTVFFPTYREWARPYRSLLLKPTGLEENFLVFQNHPEFVPQRPGRYRFRIKEIEPRYYSGLQVTRTRESGWSGRDACS